MHISKMTGIFFSFSTLFFLRRFDLVVSHITWSCTEFSIALDNFVDSFEEIFFCCHFASGTNGKHTSFCAHRPIENDKNKNKRFCFSKTDDSTIIFKQEKVEMVLTESQRPLSLDTIGPIIQNEYPVQRTLNVHES